MSFCRVALFAFLVMAATPGQAQTQPTPTFLGTLGLNSVPSARMDPVGTVRLSAGTLHPYTNGTVSAQLAPSLYMAVRQSASSSNPFSAPQALYPGLDFKLRLHQETAHTPAIAIGLQSAVGQRQLAGEYMTMSKRIWDFDFTGGVGWGRLSAGSHLPNPLAPFGHFSRARALDGIEANSGGNWFTGHTIGLMAGVEYDVPYVNGLALKADYGGGRYTSNPHDTPWSVGAAYSPWRFISLGLGLVSGDTMLAQVSLQAPVDGWPLSTHIEGSPEPMNPARSGDAEPAMMARAGAAGDLDLYNTRSDNRSAWTLLELDPTQSTPLQIGRAARVMANHAGGSVDEIGVVPINMGLRGPALVMSRDDLEAAMARNAGSPQEIWQHLQIDDDVVPPKVYGQSWYSTFSDARPLWQRFNLHLTLDNQVSVAERDIGLLYYTSLIASLQHQIGSHFVSGAAVRLNIADNLEDLNRIRPPSLNPIRSDIAGFANERVGLDRLYAGWLTSATPSLHFAASAGLLEQQFSGAGGEVLYRPFGKTYAVGVEGWEALKRDYLSPLALSPTGQKVFTGHLNGWYEIPNSDLTLG